MKSAQPKLWFESTESKVAEAIEFMREHEPPEGYGMGFSGGKDSIVLHWLAERAGVTFRPHYADTTVDPPELQRFMRKHYPHVKWVRRRKEHMWQRMINKRRIMLRHIRWCCAEYKEVGSSITKERHMLLGIRAEESARRKAYPRHHMRTGGFRVHLYYPALWFNAADVWEIIEGQGLPYPALYDEGFDRLGCVVCPFRSGNAHAPWEERFPRHYRQFKRCLCKLVDNSQRYWFMRNVHDGYQLYDLWRRGNGALRGREVHE